MISIQITCIHISLNNKKKSINKIEKKHENCLKASCLLFVQLFKL